MMVDIRIFLLLLCHAVALEGAQNVALRKPTKQSSTGFSGSPARAVDGNTDSNYDHKSCTHTDAGDNSPWWRVDLGAQYDIQGVVITNRGDCCGDRLRDFKVEVFENDPESSPSTGQTCLTYTGYMPLGNTERLDCEGCALTGRYVRISKPTPNLHMCEVQVLGDPV